MRSSVAAARAGGRHADYKRLWNEMEAHAITQETAVERLGVLHERPESIDRQASTTRTRRRILLECFDEATAMATTR